MGEGGRRLQSAPRDFHAASTSGPASCRKMFDFRREPLKRTWVYCMPTPSMIGAETDQYEHGEGWKYSQYCDECRMLNVSASKGVPLLIQAPKRADRNIVNGIEIAKVRHEGPR